MEIENHFIFEPCAKCTFVCLCELSLQLTLFIQLGNSFT